MFPITCLMKTRLPLPWETGPCAPTNRSCIIFCRTDEWLLKSPSTAHLATMRHLDEIVGEKKNGNPPVPGPKRSPKSNCYSQSFSARPGPPEHTSGTSSPSSLITSTQPAASQLLWRVSWPTNFVSSIYRRLGVFNIATYR